MRTPVNIGVAGVGPEEGKTTEEAGTGTRDKANRVNVEGASFALPERALHGGLLGARGNMRICR
jgi:hypothetical protein